MESVEFHCHISSCFLSVNQKRICNFFFYTSCTACRYCVICTTIMNVNMLSDVRKIAGDQYVLNIQVPTYILSLYITFYFIKYVKSYILFTHTHTHTCTSTTVIKSQDVRYHWQKIRRKIQIVACAIKLTSVLKQATRLYSLTIIDMYLLN